MADFSTHITASSLLGAGYGALAFFYWDLPPQQCIMAGFLCSIAGMLPDLDSDSGVPVREMLCFLAVMIPMLMIPRFQSLGMDAEQIVFVSALIYVGLRFGVGELFKRYTVHRGMWHSIPAAAIAGLVTYEVCLCEDISLRIFKSWAVVIGFVSHLVLDEIYSVDLFGRKPRIKKSFGTAMKLFGNDNWANFTTYAKLCLLVLIVLGDARLMHYYGAEPVHIEIPGSAQAREWIGDLVPMAREKLESWR